MKMTHSCSITHTHIHTKDYHNLQMKSKRFSEVVVFLPFSLLLRSVSGREMIGRSESRGFGFCPLSSSRTWITEDTKN